MTRDEAIRNINALNAICASKKFYDEEFEEALQMAVKALEQEPCEDAISRENLIAKIEDIYGGNMLYECGCCPQDFVDIAEESPTVQPKVICCKDCVHHEAEPLNFCNLHGIVMTADEFCSYAESEEKNANSN